MVNTVSERALVTAMTARVPVMLVGDPGTSKTAIINSIARDMGYDLFTLILSRMDPQDISGFPTKGVYVHNDGNSTSPVTEYAPQIWQKKILEVKKAIIFIDEFSNAHPSVQASFLSFIQDRQFPNGEFFPDEAIIVGAMNPTDSAADGYELAPASTNRMVFIPWNPSRDDWYVGMMNSWGKEISDNERKWRELIVRFIKDNPGRLHKMNTQDIGSGEVYNGLNSNDSSSMTVAKSAWPSRRSWDNVAKILGKIEKSDPALEDYILEGTVGYSTANAFRGWLIEHGTLNVAEIIANPDKFNGWKDLNQNDSFMIGRAAIDGVTQDNVKNVIRIFDIFADNDKQSYLAPVIVDFTKILNNFKNNHGSNNKHQKELMIQYQKDMMNVLKKYTKALGQSRNNK